MNQGSKHIVIFDGYCNFCSAIAKWIIRLDGRDLFRLAAAQSEAGIKTIHELNLSFTASESVILHEVGKTYTSSTAALRIARRLSGLAPLLYVFIIVPPVVRNAVYRYIASNRYRWFGKRKTCFVADESQQKKFL